MNLYFKNIRIVNPAENLNSVVNLWVKNGIIIHNSHQDAITDPDTRIIDADEMIASPGLFDLHVHFREPGDEHKETIETGTNAAMNGGFTGVLTMANTQPVVDDITVVDYIKHKAAGKLVDVEIAASITQKRDGKLLSPMLELNDAGVKIFTDTPKSIPTAEAMRRAFEYANTKDLLLSQHCEDISLSEESSMNESKLSFRLGLKGNPKISEEIILSRDIMLAEYCGNRRYHAQHISTKGSVEIIRNAKAKGLRVTCSVTPHHLLLTEDKLNDYETNFKMNPPLRSDSDRLALIEGLKDGTIDCIVSEHAPQISQDKDVPFGIAPNGIIGLESSLGLILSKFVNNGLLTLEQMIMKMSINPRKLLHIDIPKFELNSQANISIFEPNKNWTVDIKNFKSKCNNTPFAGLMLKGKPKMVINNNQFFETTL